MTLSNLELGKRNPQPSTLSKLDSGLGWPPGTFSRLASTAGTPEELDAMLDRIVDNPWSEPQPVTLSTRGDQAATLENYADAYIETLNEAIRQLPDPSTARSQPSTLAALARCAKAQVLLADSWRFASVTDQAAATRLLARMRELEKTRRDLLARIPSTMPARIDAAFRAAEFPEALIAAMTGATLEQLWQVRAEGVIPDGLNARIAAFLKCLPS
jgi:hypothetical protein